MGNIFLLSLVAAANATLLAAVTVMLFLPSPKRLLLGTPMDIALGLIALLVAYVLGSGRDERLKNRRKKEEEGAEKSPSKVEQLLGKGSARVIFAVGVVLTLPGISYLAGEDRGGGATLQGLADPKRPADGGHWRRGHRRAAGRAWRRRIPHLAHPTPTAIEAESPFSRICS